MDGGLRGCGLDGHLHELARECQVPRRRDRLRPRGQGRRPARQLGQLARDRRLARGLQVGRVAVPPPAVQPVQVAHDELRLVVDRREVRAREQLGGHLHAREHLLERRARIHEGKDLIDERLEEACRFVECAVYRRRAPDRHAVPRAQDLGAELVHRAQGHRPFAREPLHFLRVAAVRRRPDEQVARAHDAGVGHPHPGVIVGLAERVVELEPARADRDRQVVGVGLVGCAELAGELGAGLELARVDRLVPAASQLVARDATPGVALVAVDAEAVIDVAVRPHRGVNGGARDGAQARARRFGEQKAAGVDEDEPLIAVERGDVREARHEVAAGGDRLGEEARRHRLCGVDRHLAREQLFRQLAQCGHSRA